MIWFLIWPTTKASFLHEGFLLQVSDPEANPAHLVRIGGSNSAPGGPEAVVAARLFLELIQDRVIAHHHMGALADDQVGWLQPALPKLLDLAYQHPRIGHHAVPDHVRALRIEDAGGQ
jgi:hypothetical protein